MGVGSNYILVDFENCPHETARGLKGADVRLVLFLGPHQTKIPLELAEAIQPLGDRVRFIKLSSPGKNSLDFHVALLLGQLVSEDPLGAFHVVSNDQGFDSIIKYLVSRSIKAKRWAKIDDIATGLGSRPPSSPTAQASMEADVGDVVGLTGELFIKRLMNPKATKPRSLNTVATYIKNIAGPKLLPDQVQLVIQRLQAESKLLLSSTGRVSYSFEGS